MLSVSTRTWRRGHSNLTVLLLFPKLSPHTHTHTIMHSPATTHTHTHTHSDNQLVLPVSFKREVCKPMFQDDRECVEQPNIFFFFSFCLLQIPSGIHKVSLKILMSQASNPMGLDYRFEVGSF